MSGSKPLTLASELRFESFREYEDRLDALIPRALAIVRIFERRLGPRYNSPTRGALLRTFLRGEPRRRVEIVVHEAASLALDCPRLVELAAEHPARVEIRRTLASARHAHDPCVLVDMSHYLHRFHYAGMRAIQVLDDPAGIQPLLERFGELWAAAVAVRGRPAGL